MMQCVPLVLSRFPMDTKISIYIYITYTETFEDNWDTTFLKVFAL